MTHAYPPSEKTLARIAVVADVHIGNHRKFAGETFSGVNERARLCLEALRSAVEVAEKAGASLFAVAGDLLDADDSPPSIIRDVAGVLQSKCMEFAVIAGNHEFSSTDPGHSSVCPLTYCGVCVAHGHHRRFGPYVRAVPYVPSDSGLMMVKSEKGWPRGSPVLLTHLGVSDSSTPGYLAGARDSISASDLFDHMSEAGHKISVVGNWHSHQVWERDRAFIVQCGALAPTGFDNPSSPDELFPDLSPYGWLILVDVLEDGSVSWQRVHVDGPRFVKADASNIGKTIEAIKANSGLRVFVQFTGPPGGADEFQSVWDRLDALGCRYEYRASVKEREAQLAAAREVAQVDSLEESIRRYVDAAPVPDGVDRSMIVHLALEAIR